jgi:hypothetical protein
MDSMLKCVLDLKVATNLSAFLQTLSPEEKRDARYLSKFVGATAVGLFDAALNYVRNEVVLNLRKKVSVYGVELFFDAAVGGKIRDSYKDESNLDGLKDSALLDTCRKLELISDAVYLKLFHILTMRNEVAASHPNAAFSSTQTAAAHFPSKSAVAPRHGSRSSRSRPANDLARSADNQSQTVLCV